MKQAMIDKAWDECRKKQNNSLNISSFGIKHLDNHYEIPITSRISALLGENGSGKTSLLNAIKSTFAQIQTSTPGYNDFCYINGHFRGQEFKWSTESDISITTPTIVYIDVSADIHQLKNQLAAQINIDEDLNQYEIKYLTQKEQDIYKYVCRRNYKNIQFRELEIASTESSIDISLDSNIEDAVFPFFEITLQDGVEYNSKTMGLGELCSFYLIWKLLQSDKNSVILLDEPDSHLSPKSRLSLTNLLAWIADEKNCWILFTSHSIEPIQQLNDNEILLLEKEETFTQRRLDIACNKNGAMIHLGMSFSRKFLIAVEDIDAREVVSQVISMLKPDIGPICDIQIVAGGADNLKRLNTLFPKKTSVCKLITILDGDQRNNESEFLFLPGNADPIIMARASEYATAIFLSETLNANISIITRCLSSTQDVDHHDLCSVFARDLNLPGIDTAAIRKAFIKAWICSPSSNPVFVEFANELSSLIHSTPYTS